MTVAALAKMLSPKTEIIYINTPKAAETDLFYGSVTSPMIEDIFLKLGLNEHNVLPSTLTSFSLGTAYSNWGAAKRSWTQSFHKPLPLFAGVQFQHYLTRLRLSGHETTDLSDYIMSVQAAEKGRFAHPPSQRKTPLADLDYGYHFEPIDLGRRFLETVKPSRIKHYQNEITSVRREDMKLSSVALDTGEIITADFFIDTTSSNSLLTDQVSSSWLNPRPLSALKTMTSTKNMDGVCRKLTATKFGWHSETPLQGETHRLALFHPDTAEEVKQALPIFDGNPVTVTAGCRAAPWIGNYLAIGHAAAILEPLTPAPIMLLQKDIERLLELIPVSTDMTVENREYNRRFRADYTHSSLFHQTFFRHVNDKSLAYWQDTSALPLNPLLTDKITQFESRGVIVQYDYEPFSSEDWTMLHMGLGHLPRRYDMLADRAPEEQIRKRLENMRQAIALMANKLPPHQTYMTNMLKYLKENHD